MAYVTATLDAVVLRVCVDCEAAASIRILSLLVFLARRSSQHLFSYVQEIDCATNADITQNSPDAVEIQA